MTAKEVLGTHRKQSNMPHLEDEEATIDKINDKVHTAKNKYAEYRGNTLPRSPGRQTEFEEAKREFSRMTKERRKIVRRWKWEWIDDMVYAIKEAESKGDTRTVFEIHQKMGIRKEMGRRDGTARSVEDPDKEREAWKGHFHKLQEGKEEVDPRVWQKFRPKDAEATWLHETPSNKEIEKNMRKMKNGKAAGIDEVAAEVLKCVSPKLKSQIYKVVKEMWIRAQTAN